MTLRSYFQFWVGMARCALVGPPAYYAWLGVLAAVILGGLVSYYHHVTEGLIVTNMTDHVSWGISIANFVFFVGVAAAAAVLVVPAYAFKREDAKRVVIVGELLAFCSILMCMLFILTDVGRPDRLWHLSPGLGIMNLPSSLLAWDVVVFMGYLALNLHIPGYLLYMLYLGKKPWWPLYLPFAWISMAWAVSIHTVTAFLLSGLASRPFWNSPLLAPRFLISAFASGPALLILIFLAIRRVTALKVQESLIRLLVGVLRVTLPINMFLVVGELFVEFYPGTEHSIHAEYLYFGIDGHHVLTRAIWAAVACNLVAIVLLHVRWLRSRRSLLVAACALTIVGIWTEKGMGLIFPGFTPSPLGELVEYVPNFGEIIVTLAVVAIGAGLFTVMTKVALAIETGSLRAQHTDAEIEMDRARAQMIRSVPTGRARLPKAPPIPYELMTPRDKAVHKLRDLLRRL